MIIKSTETTLFIAYFLYSYMRKKNKMVINFYTVELPIFYTARLVNFYTANLANSKGNAKYLSR